MLFGVQVLSKKLGFQELLEGSPLLSQSLGGRSTIEGTRDEISLDHLYRRLCQRTLMCGTQQTRSSMGSNNIIQKETIYYSYSSYYYYYYFVYSTKSSLTRQV